jgi:hypothetical protein
VDGNQLSDDLPQPRYAVPEATTVAPAPPPDLTPAALTGPRGGRRNASILTVVGLALLVICVCVAHDDGHTSTRWSDCLLVTDLIRADTKASATLHVRVDRFSGSLLDPPVAAAKADFASTKQAQMAPGVINYQVSDLPGLGDSAYIAVQVTDAGAMRVPRVDLHVLRGDLELDVQYAGTPTTSEQTAAGAYAVAQNLMERL